MNCNFQCEHCGSRAGEKVFKEKVTSQEIKGAFLDVAENFKAEKITIAVTGGEPLLRKDLFEVMEYARSLGFNWGMVTNGFLVDNKVVQKSKKAGMTTIDISIDGLEGDHDSFRNKKGSFRRAKNAVKLYSKADFLKCLRITTVIHPGNINQLDEMYETFKNWGIDSWRLLTVDPIGRAVDNSETLLDKNNYEKVLQHVKKKRKEKSKLVVTLGCAHFLGDDFEDEVRGHFFHCATGINIGSILHNGDIFVCPNVPRKKDLIQGNIRRDKFSEVWKNGFKIFRDKNRTSCNECRKCEFWEECLGGSFHTWDFEKNRQRVCFMREDVVQ